jgi:hypothetical protein
VAPRSLVSHDRVVGGLPKPAAGQAAPGRQLTCAVPNSFIGAELVFRAR